MEEVSLGAGRLVLQNEQIVEAIVGALVDSSSSSSSVRSSSLGCTPHSSSRFTPHSSSSTFKLITTKLKYNSNNSKLDYPTHRSLSACSLASKSFLAPCRARIFRQVRFKSSMHAFEYDHVQRFLAILDYGSGDGCGGGGDGQLSGAGGVGQYVKELIIEDGYWDPDLSQILARLFALRVLHLTFPTSRSNDNSQNQGRERKGGVSWTQFDSSLRTKLLEVIKGGKLEELAVAGVRGFPIEAVFQAGRLKRLVVEGCSVDDDDGESEPFSKLFANPPHTHFLTLSWIANTSMGLDTVSSSLESLTLDLGTTNDLDELEQDSERKSATSRIAKLLESSSGSLKELVVVGTDDATLPTLHLPFLPSLPSLSIFLTTPFESSPYGLPMGLVAGPCTLIPQHGLQRLEVVVKWEDVDPLCGFVRGGLDGLGGEIGSGGLDGPGQTSTASTTSNSNSTSTPWTRLDQTLSLSPHLHEITILFDVQFQQVKSQTQDSSNVEWRMEDVMVVEEAAEAFERVLEGSSTVVDGREVMEGGGLLPLTAWGNVGVEAGGRGSEGSSGANFKEKRRAVTLGLVRG
ncbi:hypothetical protein CC1G_15483 [Coprinopsis cinerea okayama7|uniref:Uncharacterized protein n=1 Tax=Coprinopsis cinerea (strain Okayama-7 / 130 / ATCC MYA-4618 / FGSC 9003) TaxID=240176 RepID=D6RQW7_COPC7|nr:hypothetical protein CC1G_15483 [Coprinopsis cinerea okayama7\|eukprot:XP_002910206.1 hypothetical protein CC1G_15483 [Coprinopsis cinerea okayama7\